MKKTVLFILVSVLAIVGSLYAIGKEVMVIEKKDNTIMRLNVDEINCIKFEIKEDVEVSVITENATEITVSTVVLSGSAMRIPQVGTSVGFEVATSKQFYDCKVYTTRLTADGDFSLKVGGLTSNTTYYYRAYAEVDGVYYYGEVKQFTTLLSVAVTTGTATDITESSAVLSGSAKGIPQGGTSVVIEVNTSKLFSNSQKKYYSTRLTKDGDFSFKVEDLSSNTTYYYRAYAIVDGVYYYGEVKQFTTLPSVTVTTGAATEITESTVCLSGSVTGVPSSGVAGVIYGKTSNLSSSNGTIKNTTSKSNFTITLSGLSANTTYYYCAYANVEGVYYYGEVETFKTKSITTGTLNGYTWVDLGLPSGLKWATYNVGATSETSYGNIYSWGETEPKFDNSWSSYKYSTGSGMSSIGSDISGNVRYDAAKSNWGGTWRMPRVAEMEELIKYCTVSWGVKGGIYGYFVVGPNGNSIFLPAAGSSSGDSNNGKGSWGCYWTANTCSYYHAYRLYFDSKNFYLDSNTSLNKYGCARSDAYSVRPVTE